MAETVKVNPSPGFAAVGSISAAVLSAALNHSFWWGLFHFFCGWLYILYALLCRSKEILPALSAMFGA
jgi:ABC-type multidrug transport system permease subunit